jgi:uncharacterized protein with NRDE domain
MCLILVAWQGHSHYPCVIAANRDEYFSRPAETARWWGDDAHILAGRDLLAGGTWLGVTRSGRFAALTNYRGAERRPDAPSRGALVADILQSQASTQDTLRHLHEVAAGYSAFNVIFSDGERLAIYESTSAAGRELGAGIYGLSNHLLDTPWPKVENAKSALSAALSELPDTRGVLDLLRDAKPAPDHLLPRTGVSLEWERLLSSAFIRAADYGTRCSTIISVDQRGTAAFDEWSWGRSAEQLNHGHYSFPIERRKG